MICNHTLRLVFGIEFHIKIYQTCNNTISKYVSRRDSLENAIWFVLVETKTWPDISLGKICTEPVERGVYPDMSGTSYTLCKTAKCFSAESI